MPNKGNNTALKASEREAFISLVWEMGKAHARNDLPWRYIGDPYAVYVSEVMLQQTQVTRVLKFWPAWMKAFPTIDALAAASTADVLERWQGLGYNRRALSLKRSAEICAAEYAGSMPQSQQELEALPGVGPATAAGIQAFAYEKPAVYIETNVRAVFIHHFFAESTEKVSDKQLYPLVEATCSREEPRAWYYALLDYGAHLKKSIPNPSRRAAAYSRQSAFEGSVRQKRSFLLREVLAHPGISCAALEDLLNTEERAAGREELDSASVLDLLKQLECEGFFTITDNICMIDPNY